MSQETEVMGRGRVIEAASYCRLQRSGYDGLLTEGRLSSGEREQIRRKRDLFDTMIAVLDRHLSATAGGRAR